jgi:hypothetical protein
MWSYRLATPLSIGVYIAFSQVLYRVFLGFIFEINQFLLTNLTMLAGPYWLTTHCMRLYIHPFLTKYAFGKRLDTALLYR